MNNTALLPVQGEPKILANQSIKPNCSFDLFLVRSPLQYISAQAAKKLSNNNSILVVEFENDKEEEGYRQLEQIVNCSEWSEVIYLYSRTRGERLKSTRTMYARLKLKKISRVFIGEYRDIHFQLIASRFSCARYLLDDGASTIFIQQNYLSKNAIYPDFENLSIKQKIFYVLIHSVIPSRFRFLNRYHLVSEFNLSSIRASGQAVLKSPYKKILCESKLNEVWFFGSKYSEVGIMTESQELKYIVWAIQNCAAEGLAVKYIPHRAESSEKLDKLESLGVSVFRLGMPVEIYIEKYKIVPKSIAAGWSTVLVTLPNRCDFDQVSCIEIPSDRMSIEVRSRAESIYAYYHSDPKVVVSRWP